MKAIIMAGGFGTRLMPVTACCPKPLIRILDKPILQYTLELLKKHGIREACLTLGYLPEMIESFVSSNGGFGLDVTCITEEQPMGTAGSVKRCAEFLNGEDFIVISGDAMCDFDLAYCIDRHYELGSKATLVLYSHPEPLDFGLVATGENEKICGFIEKPSWDRVETDLINTGIYIFSNEILDKIPRNKPWDFGKDVFPSLLNEEYPMYGVEAKGRWCDVGSPEAYRSCTRDMLDGKFALDIPESAEVSDGVTVLEPSFVSSKAHIYKGAVIGPYSVIGEGSIIGKDSRVASSVVDGGAVLEGCNVSGAIICRRAQIMNGASLSEGSVVGCETNVGGRAVVMPEIRIWPRQEIKPGQLVSRNIETGNLRNKPEFSQKGRLEGKYNQSITPEICFALGTACAQMGKVGIASSNTAAGKALAYSTACGVAAAGGSGYMLNIGFRAGASFLGYELGLGITVFVEEQDGEVSLSFTDKNGLPVSQDVRRKLTAVFASERKNAPSDSTKAVEELGGGLQLYSAAAMRKCCFGQDKLSVKFGIFGDSAECKALEEMLVSFGCEKNDKGYGVPMFELYDGGTKLKIKDENGNLVNWEQILCILTLIEFKHGSGEVAVYDDAPETVNRIAEKFDKKVLRVGVDEGAEAIFADEPWMRDGLLAAVRICAAMTFSGHGVMDMAHRVPNFAVVTREVAVKSGRGAAMHRLADEAEFSHDGGAGLYYKGEDGSARVRPMGDKESLIITAECGGINAAEELCGRIRDIIEGSK